MNELDKAGIIKTFRLGKDDCIRLADTVSAEDIKLLEGFYLKYGHDSGGTVDYQDLFAAVALWIVTLVPHFGFTKFNTPMDWLASHIECLVLRIMEQHVTGRSPPIRGPALAAVVASTEFKVLTWHLSTRSMPKLPVKADWLRYRQERIMSLVTSKTQPLIDELKVNRTQIHPLF